MRADPIGIGDILRSTNWHGRGSLVRVLRLTKPGWASVAAFSDAGHYETECRLRDMRVVRPSATKAADAR